MKEPSGLDMSERIEVKQAMEQVVPQFEIVRG